MQERLEGKYCRRCGQVNLEAYNRTTKDVTRCRNKTWSLRNPLAHRNGRNGRRLQGARYSARSLCRHKDQLKPGWESLELASPRSLFALPAVFNGNYSYDVAPDGQRFLVLALSSRRGHEPLSAIVNWAQLTLKPNRNSR
jgi:hypothetical protein